MGRAVVMGPSLSLAERKEPGSSSSLWMEKTSLLLLRIKRSLQTARLILRLQVKWTARWERIN